MPEWEVVYKAVADFSDLMRKAAEAKAVLDALAKDIKSEGQLGVEAATRSARAFQEETTSIQRLGDAMARITELSKQYNRYVQWQGASTEEQYLSNLQKERQYTELLWRARQRGFYSPYQDYAFRNQEIAQWILLDRAMTMGYTSPDQYLNYLQQYRHAIDMQNASMIAEAAAIQRATDAWVRQTDAMSGTHATAQEIAGGLGNVGEALQDLSGGMIIPVSVLGIPAALADMQRFREGLNSIPNEKDVTIDAVFNMGALAAWAAAVRKDISSFPRIGTFVPYPRQGGGGGGPPPDSAGAAAEAQRLADAEYKVWVDEQLAAAGARDVDESTGKAAATMAQAAAKANLFAAAGRGWGTTLPVFAGVLGTVGVIHIAIDALIESILATVPALLTAVIALGVWGAAGYASALQIQQRLSAVQTAATATGQSIPPLTGAFTALQDAVRPSVWELYGTALNSINQHMGILGDLAQKTGGVVDRMAARAEVDLSRAGKGFQTFLAVGGQDLAKWGQILSNIGTALFNMLQVAAQTHITQYFLDFIIVLTKLLVLITKLPTPLLAFVIGLHAVYLWGGLAATGILALLGPLTRLAAAAGGLDAASSAMGALSKNATPMEKLTATVSDLGSGLTLLPARFGGVSSSARITSDAVKNVAEMTGTSAENIAALAANAEKGGKSLASLGQETTKGAQLFSIYGRDLNEVGQATVGLGIAAGASEKALSKFAQGAAEAEKSTGLWASVAGGLARVPIVGWIALGVAAITAFVFWAMTAKDATQNWIGQLQKMVGSSSVFNLVGNTINALGQVTQRLTQSQHLNAIDLGAMQQAHADLSRELITEVSRIGSLAHAYGTDLTGAIALAAVASVKVSAFTSQNIKDWETAQAQIAGLVEGYKMMGQGLTELQQDVSVQLVSNSDQLASMGKLNTAWDTWTKIVGGMQGTFITLAQSLGQLTTAEGAVGAKMVGLSANSLTLQADFQTVYNNAQSLLDAFRNAEAITGDQGFAGVVKQLTGALGGMAGGSKAALAQIMALAQEAGGPAFNANKSYAQNLKDLNDWAGKLGKTGLPGLYAAELKMTEQTSKLSEEAQRLTTNLSTDLSQAMAQAVLNATGAYGALNKLAASIEKNGVNSRQTKADRQQFITDMLKAHIPISVIDADLQALYGQLAPTTQQISYARAEMGHLGVASAIAADQVHKAGMVITEPSTWDKFLVNLGKFRLAVRNDIEQYVMPTLTQLGHLLFYDLGSIWDTIAAVVKTAWSILDGLFQVGANLLEGHWSAAWHALLQMFKNVWHDIEAFGIQAWHDLLAIFSGTGPLAGVTRAFEDFGKGFYDNVIRPITNYFVNTFPAQITADAKHWYDNVQQMWHDFDSNVIHKITTFFVETIPKWFTHDIPAKWDSLWQTAETNFEQKITKPLKDLFLNIFPSWWQQLRKRWENDLWGPAWAYFKVFVLTPLLDLFTKTIPGWFFSVYHAWINNVWSPAWAYFNMTIIQPFRRLFLTDIPGFFDAVGRGWSRLWNIGWGDFTRFILNPITTFFSKTVPNLASSAFKAAVNAGISVVDTGIGLINKVLGIVHLSIPTIAHLQEGGGFHGGVPGSGSGDIMPAMLEPGEFVVRKRARQAIDQQLGPGFLDQMNYADRMFGYRGGGGVRGYQLGGLVGALTSIFGGGITDLEHLIGGGADALLKLLGLGAEKVFDTVWNISVQPLINVLPHNFEFDIVDLGAQELKQGIDDFLKGVQLLGGAPHGGPATSQQVMGWILQSLAISGSPASWLGGMEQLVHNESGGNPAAVNPVTAGTSGEHAEGIAQTIPSTFFAYALPGLTDIFNPVDDLVASERYIARNYGSPYNIPNLFNPSQYQGYRMGGGVGGGGSGPPSGTEIPGGPMIPGPGPRPATLAELLRRLTDDVTAERKTYNDLIRVVPIGAPGFRAGALAVMGAQQGLDGSWRDLMVGGARGFTDTKWAHFLDTDAAFIALMTGPVTALLRRAFPGWTGDLTGWLRDIRGAGMAAFNMWRRGGGGPLTLPQEVKKYAQLWHNIGASEKQLGKDWTDLYKTHPPAPRRGIPPPRGIHRPPGHLFPGELVAYAQLLKQEQEQAGDFHALSAAGSRDMASITSADWTRLIARNSDWWDQMAHPHGAGAAALEQLSDLYPGRWGYVERDLVTQNNYLRQAFALWRALYGPGGKLGTPGPVGPRVTTPGPLGQGVGARAVGPPGPPPGWPQDIPGGQVSQATILRIASTGIGWPHLEALGSTGAVAGQGGGLVSSIGIMPSLPAMARGGLVGMQWGGVVQPGMMPPRQLSDAAAATGAQQSFQVDQIVVNNPIREPAGESVSRAVNRLSFMAGRGAL